MIARSIERNGPEVVVIGAGPHGLAVAAHLRSRGVATHTLGESMSFWRRNMPKGMKLRSPLAATDISDPEKALSLEAWSAREGAALVEPLPIEAFIGYGEWFQTRAAPDLDRRVVARRDDRQWISAGARRRRGASLGAWSSPPASRATNSALRFSQAPRQRWSAILPITLISAAFATNA